MKLAAALVARIVLAGSAAATLRSARDATSGPSLRAFDPAAWHACPTLLREIGSSW